MKPPNRTHAVMAQRNPEDRESLDPFPTPPWGTRALMEFIIDDTERTKQQIVWEPACGEGHMAKVLKEYFGGVVASDIHPYGYGSVADFLSPETTLPEVDWVITNPPFRHAEKFIDKSYRIARRGVAMLTRTVFIEGTKRYDRLFSKNPPSVVAQFSERIPMVKGRLDRKASSATAYCWLVWDKLNFHEPRIAWIPPCRKALEREDDYN